MVFAMLSKSESGQFEVEVPRLVKIFRLIELSQFTLRTVLSSARRYPGRPRIEPELEELVVQMAKEDSGWGYDRIVGALANLGSTLSDETVGNVLRRNAIPAAPEPKQTTTWKDFIGRWIKPVKEEALSKLILFGEVSLRRVLREYLTHFQ